MWYDPQLLQRTITSRDHKAAVETMKKVLGIDKMIGLPNDGVMIQAQMATLLLLDAIGENVEREGLLDTPKRVAKMWINELSTGLKEDPAHHLRTTFDEGHDEMVVVKDIPFFSYCEHHLVPFFGVAHVGYIPSEGKVVGLSKFARILDAIARRPQVQENITSAMADTIVEALNPLGVGVVITAEHMCMTMRGVQKPGSKTTTSALRGVFREKAEVRAEFMSLVNADK